MKKTYTIHGIHCQNCIDTITAVCSEHADIRRIEISQKKSEITFDLKNDIPLTQLNTLVRKAGNYKISETKSDKKFSSSQSKFKTYKPLIIVVSYILLVTLLVLWHTNNWSMISGMRVFMGAFYLSFSFFKILDIRGFASSYRNYDIIAKRFPVYATFYPFIELLLGILFFTIQDIWIVAMITFIIMSVSIIGVIQAVLSQQKIRCACLGTVFQLPMTTVTIVEDALMIFMSLVLLVRYFVIP